MAEKTKTKDNELRVSGIDSGLPVEPLCRVEKEMLEEFFARIDAMKGDPLFPEGRKQNLAPIREYFEWDSYRP